MNEDEFFHYHYVEEGIIDYLSIQPTLRIAGYKKQQFSREVLKKNVCKMDVCGVYRGGLLFTQNESWFASFWESKNLRKSISDEKGGKNAWKMFLRKWNAASTHF